MVNIKAIDLHVGNKFDHNGETYQVTANKEMHDGVREVFTFCVPRPRTAPIRFYFQPNEIVKDIR